VIEGCLEIEHNIKIDWFSTTSGLLYGETEDGSTITFYCRPCLDIENYNWLCYQIVLQIYPQDHPIHKDYSWVYHPYFHYYSIGLGDADFLGDTNRESYQAYLLGCSDHLLEAIAPHAKSPLSY
jgi:hypothetical protein